MTVSRTNSSSPGTDSDGRAGVVELVRQLSDDSRRLARDEIRLAKLEMADGLRAGGRGAMVLGVAFGAGVIALSALTMCVIAALSLAIGKVWIGALITGVVEIGLGVVLVRRGSRDFEGIPNWVANGGQPSHRGRRATTSGRAD